jgi:hypothetical protein
MCYNYSNLGSVVINCSYDCKWSINPITIPNPSLVTDTCDSMKAFGVANGHCALGMVNILSLADLLDCLYWNCVYRSGILNILLIKNKKVVFRLVLCYSQISQPFLHNRSVFSRISLSYYKQNSFCKVLPFLHVLSPLLLWLPGEHKIFIVQKQYVFTAYLFHYLTACNS